MNNTRVTFGQRATRAGVVVAALLLLTGATWRGISAATQSAATRATTVAAPLATSLVAGRDSYADVVKVAAPAVVTIHADGRTRVSATQFQLPNDDLLRRFFGEQGGPSDDGPRQPRTFRQSALGSGVIVTTDGYILTNQHVVDGADQIHVEMTDGRTLTAKVVGSDKPSDLALLKVDASDFHPIALGNSDAVQVGDVVLAVGNPLGVGQTVTMGIISAKGRSTSTRGAVSYEDFLQTDAPINQGNSGGALVNTKGELVGINSQILSNSNGNIGIGFAIPSNMARHVMDDLRTKGRVTRAQLGVAIQPVTSDMAASLGLKDVGGAIISSVTSGSAADRAGLKRGDVIKAFNGQPVRDINTLRNHVADAGPGSTADVTILRDGSEKHVSVKLDEAAVNQTARDGGTSAGSDDKTTLGVSVAPVTPETASRMRLPRNARGVVVEEVNPDGRAADAGIQAGDIIEEVNRQGSEIFVTVRPSNG
jgi:serine protease Do